MKIFRFLSLLSIIFVVLLQHASITTASELEFVKHATRHNFILTQITSTDSGTVDLQNPQYNDAMAFYWGLKSAEQGFAPAQHLVGHLYYEGRGIPKDDIEAFRWMQKSAEQRYVPAQYFLGYMYHRGIGIPKDQVHAYAWISLAASADSENSEILLSGLEVVTKIMSPAEITEAQQLAKELAKEISNSL